MKLTIAALFLLFCAEQISSTKFLDQLSKQGSQLISQSRIPHKTTRQCSCKENDECVFQMKEQTVDCINTCWTKAGTITEKPQMLKDCFIRKRYIVDQFIDCIQNKMNTCVNTDDGPQIPYTDIHQLIRLGEQKIESQVESFKKTLGGGSSGGNGDVLIDTALDIADCVKECFVSKNANGFCFDRMNCQPLIKEDNNARRSLKYCMRTVGWKKEASELCECAVNAGVNEMNQYCAMLRTISGGSRPSHSDN
ncbi:hypothetical protein L596_005123 [Steinernema carpocapsae]|uniref:Chondroitin proteoglycan 4 domain-containing protein n=1 Tax=Steinernema carpocapsae TaxID=34508 RepID=A0A4U8UZ18_STECR|nr:hypothetical protein L596_005123 [Steinernema carpocapsae]